MHHFRGAIQRVATGRGLLLHHLVAIAGLRGRRRCPSRHQKGCESPRRWAGKDAEQDADDMEDADGVNEADGGAEDRVAEDDDDAKDEVNQVRVQ